MDENVLQFHRHFMQIIDEIKRKTCESVCEEIDGKAKTLYDFYLLKLTLYSMQLGQEAMNANEDDEEEEQPRRVEHASRDNAADLLLKSAALGLLSSDDDLSDIPSELDASSKIETILSPLASVSSVESEISSLMASSELGAASDNETPLDLSVKSISTPNSPPNESTEDSNKKVIQEQRKVTAKRFRCTWGEGCGFVGVNSWNTVQHVRVRHFKLPQTIKEQKAKQIEDDRNPRDYVVEYEVEEVAGEESARPVKRRRTTSEEDSEKKIRKLEPTASPNIGRVFRCTWSQCDYAKPRRPQVWSHVRSKHFNGAKTSEDGREAKCFIETIPQDEFMAQTIADAIGKGLPNFADWPLMPSIEPEDEYAPEGGEYEATDNYLECVLSSA